MNMNLNIHLQYNALIVLLVCSWFSSANELNVERNVTRAKREPPIIIYRPGQKYHVYRRKPKPSYGPPRPVYGPPKSKYGPPKPQYGPPSSSYGAPSAFEPPTPSLTYGTPSLSYETPPPSSSSSSFSPSTSYGTNNYAPTATYGAPPSSSYGAPPSPTYGVPASSYGPPSTSYGPPNSYPPPPPITYNTPNSNYGTPSFTGPSYTNFNPPAPNYGSPSPSPTPSQTYNPSSFGIYNSAPPSIDYSSGSTFDSFGFNQQQQQQQQQYNGNTGGGVNENYQVPNFANLGPYDKSPPSSYSTPGAVTSYGTPINNNHESASNQFETRSTFIKSKKRTNQFNDAFTSSSDINNKFLSPNHDRTAEEKRIPNHNYDGPGIMDGESLVKDVITKKKAKGKGKERNHKYVNHQDEEEKEEDIIQHNQNFTIGISQLTSYGLKLPTKS